MPKGGVGGASGGASGEGLSEDSREVEAGVWHYLVVVPKGVRPRHSATYDKAAKLPGKSTRYLEGAIVRVDTRVRVGWTKFLKLEGAPGWLFDVSPEDRSVRLVEVDLEHGNWEYEVVSLSGVRVHATPMRAASAAVVKKTSGRGGGGGGAGGLLLAAGDVVSVSERMRPVPTASSAAGTAVSAVTGFGGPSATSSSAAPMGFLKLNDGRGWVAEASEGGARAVVPWTGVSSSSVMAAGGNRGGAEGSLTGGGGGGVVKGNGKRSSSVGQFGEAATLWGGEAEDGYAPLAGEGEADQGRGGTCSFGVSGERGDWTYLVLDPKGISPRKGPTYDKSAKLKGEKLSEGEVVRVVERLLIGGDIGGGHFLRLAGGRGWVFDVPPTAKTAVRMQEVRVEKGDFRYLVTAERGVALRSRAAFSERAKVTRNGAFGTSFWGAGGPERGEILSCSERLRCGETDFLRLSNGKGWVFDIKNGRRILEPLTVLAPDVFEVTQEPNLFSGAGRRR